MNYYDSFLFNTQMPSAEYKTNEQEILNDMFFDSPTWQDDIYQETEFGSLEFQKIQARIVQIMDSKVGDRINDDYRKIIFPDLNFRPALGSRYKFNDNIWIVYSTSNIKTVHSACYIRRCNNTINVQDKYGNIHEEPCIIDIKPTKSGVQEQEYMTVPIARQILMYQYNQWTKPLFINSRIMFNRQVYKIGAMMDLNRTETFDKDSIYFVKCYIDDDLVNEYDNLELQCADYKTYNYFIVTQDRIQGVVGTNGQLNATVTLDGNNTEEKVNWYSSDEQIVSINKETGEYVLNNIGTAKIVAKMANNENYIKEISVSVLGESVEQYQNVILPNIDYISLGTTQEYSVYETLNGEKTDTKFDISFSGISQKHYKSEITDNSFNITNILPDDNNLLKVECKNLRDNSVITIEIELGGLF